MSLRAGMGWGPRWVSQFSSAPIKILSTISEKVYGFNMWLTITMEFFSVAGGNFGTRAKRNVLGIIGLRVGDLLISGRGDFRHSLQ